MSDIDHGPAVHDRCYDHKNTDFHYPARYNDRVPKTVRMTRGARSDLFAQHDLTAKRGKEYPAWTNRHGAVSAILPDGNKLGLRPDEFEVVEFLDQ